MLVLLGTVCEYEPGEPGEPTHPPAHTFEILLLTMIACKPPPFASRLRPTSTGAPGNAFLVKRAVHDSVGFSSVTRVSRTSHFVTDGFNIIRFH